MNRRQICEDIVKNGLFKLQESEQDSIEDIVMAYSTWSGTNMKYSIECCVEELKAAEYSPEQVKEYFDSDGYRTEDNPEGCWDPEFANGVVNSLEELNNSTTSEDFTEEDAVAAAFPNASPHTVDIIAGWYRNEGAVEDFTDVDEFAEYIKSDFMSMFWAGDYNNAEFHEVATDMINAGYFEADDFPYDEDLDESVNKKAIKEAQDDEAYVDEVIEKFCILMDWEIKPEDIQAVAEADGKYIMHLNSGDSFTYDPENDCIED